MAVILLLLLLVSLRETVQMMNEGRKELPECICSSLIALKTCVGKRYWNKGLLFVQKRTYDARNFNPPWGSQNIKLAVSIYTNTFISTNTRILSSIETIYDMHGCKKSNLGPFLLSMSNM